MATKLIVQEEGHEKMTCKPDMMADGDCWIAVLTPRVSKFSYFVSMTAGTPSVKALDLTRKRPLRVPQHLTSPTNHHDEVNHLVAGADSSIINCGRRFLKSSCQRQLQSYAGSHLSGIHPIL